MVKKIYSYLMGEVRKIHNDVDIQRLSKHFVRNNTNTNVHRLNIINRKRAEIIKFEYTN